MVFGLEEALKTLGLAPPDRRRLPSLVLASASPRRQQLLAGLGLSFRVVTSQVEELHLEHLTAQELCRANARHKALAVSRQWPRELVLGADTLVFADRETDSGAVGQELFGKPASLAEAEAMLGRLQARSHWVITGVCLVSQQPSRREEFAELTRVQFRSLSAAQIRDYLARVNPLDKAGAYGIQDHGESLVVEIEGSLSNVIGLPLEALIEALTRWPKSPAASGSVQRP
jgi:septum formation protein